MKAEMPKIRFMVVSGVKIGVAGSWRAVLGGGVVVVSAGV